MASQFSESLGNNGPSDPWQKYTHRNEERHRAEDVGRLFPSQDIPSASIINDFIRHGSDELESSIPRQHQILRDFLNEAVTTSSRSFPSIHNLAHDIAASSRDYDIALLDDRWNNTRSCDAGRQWDGDKYKGEVIASEKQSIPQLHNHLTADRLPRRAEKRILCLPNPTSAGALILASTVPRRSAVPLRNLLRRYLRRETLFALTLLTWGFLLEFHIPYYAVRYGKNVKDRRQLCGKSLRASIELPLRPWSIDKQPMFYHEAQTSALIIGPDEWVWTTYFLLDTFFGSEERLPDYLADCNLGEGFDPPLGGAGRMDNPHFNPREYFLAMLDRRIMQVRLEWTALIEIFDERMVAYAEELSKMFEDDSKQTHTKILNNVILTIQDFMSVLNAPIDAWRSFKEGRLRYFATNGATPLKWQGYYERIEDHVAQLAKLYKDLSIKLDSFKEKQAGLSRASGLKESVAATDSARSAVLQGVDIRILTRMTVYIYLPMGFTIAFFSMPFIRPSHPWPIFLPIFLITIAINYMIASKRCCFRRVIHRRRRSLGFTSVV